MHMVACAVRHFAHGQDEVLEIREDRCVRCAWLGYTRISRVGELRSIVRRRPAPGLHFPVSYQRMAIGFGSRPREGKSMVTRACGVFWKLESPRLLHCI